MSWNDAATARVEQSDLLTRVVRRGLEVPRVPTEWRLAAFAGRFSEISGDPAGATLTLVFRLVFEAQTAGQPVAWIGRRDSTFFPPDVAESGIDLGAMPVVLTPSTLAAAEAADLLVRCGAFGLVVLDLGMQSRLPLRAQTRLVGLAKQHDSAVVCLTEKDDDHPSIGSLISLRAHAVRNGREGDRYRCEIRILKDKRRGPGWTHAEVCRGPAGLH